MSFTKISDHKNLNQLQQVEMRLHHVTFITLCQTTWSSAHAYYVILSDSLKNMLALHTRPLHTLLELLLNIKGQRDLNYIQSQ